mmetsp:Transcript_113364/g.241919  ORF Transcript_113364/g.241919 Transcript_113364/m.241919 type:complete len:212 (-) Transcript_113364:387-1022(-)
MVHHGEAACITQGEVKARCKEAAHNRRMAMSCRPHAGGARPAVPCVNLCGSPEERCRDAVVARHGSPHQWGVAVLVACLLVGGLRNKELNRLGAPTASRQVQRRVATVASRSEIGPSLEEALEHPHSPSVRGEEGGGPAEGLLARPCGGGAARQQLLDLHLVDGVLAQACQQRLPRLLCLLVKWLKHGGELSSLDGLGYREELSTALDEGR